MKQSNNILRQYVPILEWLPQYQLDWLKTDLIAGLTIGNILKLIRRDLLVQPR